MAGATRGSAATHPAVRRPGAPALSLRNGVTILGIVLLLGGLLVFGHYQTQAMFRDIHLSELRDGLVPRNDGGILFGAVTAVAGLTMVLATTSPLPPRRRVAPSFVFATAATLILVSHFTIFINSWSIPSQRFVYLQASFLFHDTSAVIGIATFTLALATLMLITIAGLALLALLLPGLLEDHFLRPTSLYAHRARLLVITLVLLAGGATFTRWFLQFAIRSDASPSGQFLNTNLIAIYYLLAFLLVGALALAAWRASRLLWGNLEHRVNSGTLRAFDRLHRSETWLWGLILGLNAVILLAEPIYSPDFGADRVFAMNSRGVSWVFLLVVGIYFLQRRSTREYLRFLRRQPRPLPRAKGDRLLALAISATAIWSLLWIPGPLLELTPLSTLALRMAPIAVILLALSLRPQRGDKQSMHERCVPMLLFAGTALSLLIGIMIWGIGNSMTVIYSAASGGFLTPEGRLLQPYSTGLRLLGALFLLAPILLVLWLMSTRRSGGASPGPLVVAGAAFILAINLIFTIDPGGRFDSAIGQTDVLIGFWAFLLATPADIAFMLILFSASAAIGLVAVLVLCAPPAAPERIPPSRAAAVWRDVRARLPGARRAP